MEQQGRADTVVVLDFETTGLSPQQGDRAIEIGAVLLDHGQVVDRFQRLMNPGRRVSPFIEDFTGITNEMLATAAPCAEVMAEFADFIGDHDLVAHNASFDRRFLEAELDRIDLNVRGRFGCSLLTARRLYQDAPGHRLETLVRHMNLPADGTFHRALADSEMAAHLWLRMLADLDERYELAPVPFTLMQQLARTPKKKAQRFLEQWNG